MIVTDIANAFLCLAFFALSYVGMRQRNHLFSTLNLLGGLWVAGFETVDHSSGLLGLELWLIPIPIVLLFICDGIMILRPHWGSPSSVPTEQEFCIQEIALLQSFAITDERRMRRELDQQKGLRVDDRQRVARLWRRANAALLHRRFDRAREWLEQALKMAPCSIPLTSLAAVLLGQQQYEMAIMKADLALEVDPENYEACMNRTLAMLYLDKTTEAFAGIARAKQIHSLRPEPWLWEAYILRKQGEYGRAVASCEAALRLDEKQTDAWYLRGACLSRAGRLDEALGCFERALAIDGHHLGSHLSRGNVLLKLGRWAEAAESYRDVLRACPGHIEALNNRGIALGKIGSLREAIRCYNKALRLNPEYHEAWLNRALAHDAGKETAKALESYKRFLQCAPPQMHKHIAIIWRRIAQLSSDPATAA